MQEFEAFLFYGLRVFSSVFEMLLAFILVDGFFRYKFNSPWPKRAAFTVCTLALLALQEAGTSGELGRLAELALIFAVSMLFYEGKLKLKIICNAVFFISVVLSTLLSEFAFSQFIDKLEFINHNGFFYRIVAIELSGAFLFLIVTLLGLFVKTKKNGISSRYWIMLLSVPVTTLITLTVFQYYAEQLPPGEEINTYMIVSSLGLVFINVLVFVLFGKLQSQNDIQRKEELMHMQMRLEGESYKQLEESYNRTRALRHDLKNHLVALRSITEHGSREELLEDLNTMTDAVEESTYVSVSGNSAVDAVLNEKLIASRRQRIALQFDVCPLSGADIPAMDMCVILGNALDNAFEACLKLDEDADRYVHLRVTRDAGSIFIAAENPVKDAPKRIGGLYATSKSDKEYHGLGLKNIKRAAQKHNGSMITKCDGGLFTLVVELKIE